MAYRSPAHHFDYEFSVNRHWVVKQQTGVDRHRERAFTRNLHFSKHKTEYGRMLIYGWRRRRAFYCENNQQCLNLLCIGWMISRFSFLGRLWFQRQRINTCSSSSVHQFILCHIWNLLIRLALPTERIHSSGNVRICVDSIWTMRDAIWNEIGKFDSERYSHP